MKQSELAEKLEYKGGKLYWKIDHPKKRTRAGDLAGTLNKGYLFTKIDGKIYPNHRLIFFLHHGYWPKIVDHINRDTQDNRIENLREVTAAGNALNRGVRKDNKLGIMGVRLHRSGRYEAIFMGKSLGYFDTTEEASKTYEEAKWNKLKEL